MLWQSPTFTFPGIRSSPRSYPTDLPETFPKFLQLLTVHTSPSLLYVLCYRPNLILQISLNYSPNLTNATLITSASLSVNTHIPH